MLSDICCGVRTLMTGPFLELWPSCRLERTEIFEMKTRQKTAELLISPHSLYLVSASPHWRHPGAFNLITGGNVAVTGIVVWSPSHPWRIFQVIILHGVLISLPSSNYMKEQWNIKKLWDIIRGKNWQKQWCSFIATVMAIEEDPWRHWAVLSARARVTNCGGREVVVKKMCRCRSVGPRPHGPRHPPPAPPSLHRTGRVTICGSLRLLQTPTLYCLCLHFMMCVKCPLTKHKKSDLMLWHLVLYNLNIWNRYI